MTNRLEISAGLSVQIDRELAPGEMIQWIDQPIVRSFTARLIRTFLSGIPWIVFALFWIGTGPGYKDLFMNGFNPSILSLLFCGVLFILFASFTGKRTAQNTVYIITDRRAILFEATAPRTIRSYLPNQLQSVYRQENKDGSGNVIITIYYVKDSDGDERKDYAGFVDIRHPKEAEKFLK